MHRLEITGETPEALYINVVKTLSIFLRGAPAPVSVPQEETPSSDNGSSQATEHDGSTPSDGATPGLDKVVAASKKRGSKKTEPKVLNDEIGDLGVKPALTYEGDIAPRLRAIMTAHTDRGNDMPTCISYLQKLYGPFGIQKGMQLKPEQFEEFMEASEGYLSGEA